jgi:hypothetical protein
MASHAKLSIHSFPLSTATDMPQKEACEHQIFHDTKISEAWRFDYRGVSDLIRRAR